MSLDRVGYEERLMSPYSGYDAVDDESLYQNFRLQSHKARQSEATTSSKGSLLFSPKGDDDIMEGQGGFLWKLLA